MDSGTAPGGLSAAGSPPARRRLIWAAAVLSAGAALGTSIGIAVAVWQIDFGVYIAGARHLATLYTYIGPHDSLKFTYPPFAALAFVPLAHLPGTLARVIWAVVSAASLAGLIASSLRSARPSIRSATCWRTALLLAGPACVLNPVLVNLSLGQVNLLLALLVAADLLATGRSGRAWLPQGVLTGIAAAVKLTPLVVVPYLLLTGRKSSAARALATFVVCEAVAALAAPASSLTYWSKDVFNSSRAGGLLYISNQNLDSVVERFHHGLVPAALVLPAAAVVGLAGIALAAVAYRRSSPLLGLLVCEATGLVVSPITWVHHLVWVAPAIVWLAFADDRPAHGPALAIGTAVLFWAAPIWWVPNRDLRELKLDTWQLLAGNSFFFALVAFLLGVSFLLVRRRRLARTPSLP
jgi:alpha-1,2-mannosyltransferase